VSLIKKWKTKEGYFAVILEMDSTFPKSWLNGYVGVPMTHKSVTQSLFIPKEKTREEIIEDIKENEYDLYRLSQYIEVYDGLSYGSRKLRCVYVPNTFWHGFTCNEFREEDYKDEAFVTKECEKLSRQLYELDLREFE
jgi:hypothetical protein